MHVRPYLHPPNRRMLPVGPWGVMDIKRGYSLACRMGDDSVAALRLYSVQGITRIQYCISETVANVHCEKMACSFRGDLRRDEECHAIVLSSPSLANWGEGVVIGENEKVQAGFRRGVEDLRHGPRAVAVSRVDVKRADELQPLFHVYAPPGRKPTKHSQACAVSASLLRRCRQKERNSAPDFC